MISGERITTVFSNRVKAVVDHITRPVLLAQTTSFLGSTPGLSLGSVEYAIQINSWLKLLKVHLQRTPLQSKLQDGDLELIDRLITETDGLLEEYGYEGLLVERVSEALATCHEYLKKRETAAWHDYTENLVTEAWSLDRIVNECYTEFEYLESACGREKPMPFQFPGFYLLKAKDAIENVYVLSVLNWKAT